MNPMAISRNSSYRRRENALQLRGTSWKRNSSVGRRKNWNRRAWQDQMGTPRRNRWSAGKPKSAAMSLVPVAQARNTRSAMARVQQPSRELLNWQNEEGFLAI